MSGLRGFSLWHRVWGLLHLDMLLVTKHALGMNHFEGEAIVARITVVWLSNFSALYESLLFTTAFRTYEYRFFHLGNGVTRTDYDTFETDKLVNVRGI
mgnify:CR=1 FL=1